MNEKEEPETTDIIDLGEFENIHLPCHRDKIFQENLFGTIAWVILKSASKQLHLNTVQNRSIWLHTNLGLPDTNLNC